MRLMRSSISRKARSSSQSCPNMAKNPLSRLWNVGHIGEILSRRIYCSYSSLLNIVLHD